MLLRNKVHMGVAMPRYERKGEGKDRRGCASFHASRSRCRQVVPGGKAANSKACRIGYYALVDSKGRFVDTPDTFVMNYNELVQLTQTGYMSPGMLLEQADLNGNHLAYWKLGIGLNSTPKLERIELGVYQLPLMATVMCE